MINDINTILIRIDTKIMSTSEYFFKIVLVGGKILLNQSQELAKPTFFQGSPMTNSLYSSNPPLE